MEATWKLAKPVELPGATILGGAASGFSYEGARHDALAREDAARRRMGAANEQDERRPDGRRSPAGFGVTQQAR